MTGTMTGAIEPVVVPTCSQHRLAACVGVMMPEDHRTVSLRVITPDL